MKYLKFLLLCTIIGSAVSCQKDDNGDDPSDPIVGTWEIVEATGTLADVNIGTIYRYNSDGTFRIGEGILASEGTFERTADTLSMNFTSAGITFTYTYVLAGNRLELDNTTSDQNFVLEKQ